MLSRCELVNTYEVLEHVMGIQGLHPHRLDTIRGMRTRLARHLQIHPLLADGVVLDVGCGSGAGTRELAGLLPHPVIGVDINPEAIKAAREQRDNPANLSFFHGDLSDLLREQPNLKIAGVMCVSVSMFLPDVAAFYRQVHAALLPSGILIDAPFMFRDAPITTQLQAKTYSVCGCNMKMFRAKELRERLRTAGFGQAEAIEHGFDLMKLHLLFRDYPARYLLSNFCRNVIKPPTYFGKISSLYLFTRTLSIFLFFLRHRARYASGELVALKIAN